MRTVDTAFIINPVAGRGRTAQVWEKIKEKLDRNRVHYKPYFTGRHGHGFELAAKAQKDGAERLVVLGGDGTLHEVINGMDRRRSAVGIIPTGTGNDFCRSAGLPLDPLEALRVLESGQMRSVDLGKVNGRFFINMAGIGLDAQVAYEVNRHFRFLRGTAAYVLALFKVLLTYGNREVELSLDGQTQRRKVLFVAVANGQFIGGGMKMVPPARLDDGWFHLCVAGDVGKFDTLLTLPKIYRGGHAKHPLVSFPQAKEVEITSTEPMVVHADGEIIGQLPAKFTIVPNGVNLLVTK